MTKKIAAAVIGLGANGLTTVEAALKSGCITNLVGVDIDPRQCEIARKKFGISISTLEKVMSDPEIELIYISTSNEFHYPIGKQALESGKKVCMEKPMGISLEQTEDLLQVVKKTNGYLDIAFECRYYSKLYVKIKEILDSGEIGRLKHINCQYCISPFGKDEQVWRYKKGAGGLFHEKLCHYIDLPRWWDGTRVCRYFVTSADNVIPYFEYMDNVELTYQFESGVVSHLTFIKGAAGEGPHNLIDTELLDRQKLEGYRLSYQLVGTEGAIEANVFFRQLRVFHHAGKKEIKSGSKMVRVESWKQEEDRAYFHNDPEKKADVACRAAQGLPPIMDPEDAAETMRLCFEFEEAAGKSWQVVER